LKIALQKTSFQIIDVQEFEIHGGSIRVIAQKKDSKAVVMPNVQRLLQWEDGLGLYDEQSYLRFARHVSMLKEELLVFLQALKQRGKKIAAYGASAKGNVLLNYCEIGKEILEYIVDDTPAKQGKLCPGVHLPIVSRAHLNTHPPQYLLLLAWNFVDELVHNTNGFHLSGGRYIIPIPSLRIL
jgi:hypothetical protein